jgi:PKD repeat protein
VYVLDSANNRIQKFTLMPTEDQTPPSSITGLSNSTYQPTSILWTWKDPEDTDFSNVIVYVNNVLKANIAKGIQEYQSAGLSMNTNFTISTRTVDAMGNVNLTWVNCTAKTAPFVAIPAPIPPGTDLPNDLNADGRYEDVNGNGRTDFADVVLFFNQMTWIAANEPLAAFDYNGNGRIDFADVVWLFNNL